MPPAPTSLTAVMTIAAGHPRIRADHPWAKAAWPSPVLHIGNRLYAAGVSQGPDPGLRKSDRLHSQRSPIGLGVHHRLAVVQT